MFRKFTIAVLVVVLSTCIAYADDQVKEAEVNEVITIRSSGFRNKKPIKEFGHKIHQGKIGCDKCHHGLNATGESLWGRYIVYKCDTCHDDGVANRKFNTPKKAFHANCKACHKSMKGVEGSSVKGACKECHIKKMKKKRPAVEGC